MSKEIEVKQIVDNDCDVAVNDPAHHIKEIKEEIRELAELTPAPAELQNQQDIWNENE
jgi:hypothetical protein